MAEQVYTGVCAGGPLDGREVTVRSADGFLAADKAAAIAWIYRRQPDGSFAINTDHDDSMIYPYGPATGLRQLQPDRAARAAAVGQLDVIAVEGAS
jgi:hypothetical protein